MEKIKATDLVVDYSLYPRGDVDAQNISYMVRSLEAGHTLPPVVVDKKSLRIVDGVHRWNAWRKYSGKEDVEIECVLKAYKDDAAMFLDAARFNASHGSQLTTFDRAKCLLKAQELRIPLEDIADALCITIEKAGELRQDRSGHLRMASAEGSSIVAFTKDNTIPLKRSIRHMAGRTLSKKQAEINQRLSGMEPVFHVNQLLMLIEGELIDLEDARVIDALERLWKTLGDLKKQIAVHNQ